MDPRAPLTLCPATSDATEFTRSVMTRSFLPGARIFRSLRHHNYAIWACGALVSNIGTWMQRTAQDWFVLTGLTQHDATAVGLTMALQFGPQLLLLPFTGLAADRFDRRKLLIVTQGLMGTLALALGLLAVCGTPRLWEVDLFALLFGCVSAFDSPARQTFVSELVGDADLPNAVALNSLSFNAGRMLGPAAGGLCIAALGVGWAFVVNGLSFFAVLASLALLRQRELHVTPRALHSAEGVVSRLLSGLRYVLARRDLTVVMIMLALIGTFGINFAITISTMAAMTFHMTAGGYGLLTSAMAGGTIIGAVFAARRETVTLQTITISAGAFGVTCLISALAPTYDLFAVSLIFTGAAVLTFTTATNSMMQLASAVDMRGRVMAIRLAVAMGGTPLGSPITGWIANTFGPRWGLGLGAVAGFAALAVALLFGRLREAAPSETA